MCLARGNQSRRWLCTKRPPMSRVRRLTGYLISVSVCLLLKFCDCGRRRSQGAISAFLRVGGRAEEPVEGWAPTATLQKLWPQQHQTLRRDLVVIVAATVLGYMLSYHKQRFRAAPQIDKIAPMPISPSLGALYVAGLYGSNIAYNVMNKRLLTAYPCPVFITSVNFGTCSFCCIALWILRLQPAPKAISMSFLARALPLAFLHWLSILFANISLAEVNIPFTHTVKASEPLFTAAIVMVMERTLPKARVLASLFVVVAGVFVASLTEVSFTWLGFWAAIASNLGVSLRSVLSKRLIAREEEDPVNFIAILHTMAFVLSLPAAVITQRQPGSCIQDLTQGLLQSSSAKWLVPMIGFQMCLFQMASIMVLSKTTPLAHSMIRTLRRPILIVASVIAFRTPTKPANAAGVLLALLGACLYQGGVEVHPLKVFGANMPRSNSGWQLSHDHHRHIATIT